jgi:hypothetical protein
MSAHAWRSTQCALAIALAVAVEAAFAQMAPSTAPYLSGGANAESRADMQRSADEYDLRVVFKRRPGESVSHVYVVVRDAAGTGFVTTVTAGPWFYAHVPPGSYEMTATLGAQTLSQRFSVPVRGHRALVFRFVDE